MEDLSLKMPVLQVMAGVQVDALAQPARVVLLRRAHQIVLATLARRVRIGKDQSRAMRVHWVASVIRPDST